jgi:ferredoxin-NADP reductase
MRVEAGQFFNWRFLGVPGWTRAHPYSLSAAPRPDLLRITVKDLGDGSGAVPSLRPGARVIAEGPYGRLTGAARRRARLTFLACGIGITPIRALLESEFYRRGEAVLIYRVSGPGELTFYRELEQLSRDRGVEIHYLVGPRSGLSWLPAGHTDAVQELMRLAPHVAGSDVYLCGPAPWMASVSDTLDRVGVAAAHIHHEMFSW